MTDKAAQIVDQDLLAVEAAATGYDWVIGYMGATFAPKAYGPEQFDCWGLVWHVARFRGGIELPRFDDVAYQLKRINAEIEGQAMSDDWVQVDAPAEYDTVLMRRAGEAYHVGIFLNVDGGRILHACPEGILCSQVRDLHAMGFQHLTYWHHAD